MIPHTGIYNMRHGQQISSVSKPVIRPSGCFTAIRGISTSPLQVAAARLLGYRWPVETDLEIELSENAQRWRRQAMELNSIVDEDGIVCIPSVRGERPAHERLLQLLQRAWGEDWRDTNLAELLSEARSTTLDDWLRNRFFDDHCRLFQHRPFLWHVWDGRRCDGFHALVSYHRLAGSDGEGSAPLGVAHLQLSGRLGRPVNRTV